MGNIDIQQIQSMSMNVLAISVFAQAMGTMVAAGSLAEPVSGQSPTQRAITELKSMYGQTVVDRAMGRKPYSDIPELAREIDQIVVEDMVKKYGEWETDTALQSAPAGNLVRAREIAKSLSERNVTFKSSTPAVSKAIEIGDRKADIAEKRISLIKGRSKGVPVIDTKTGVRYPSQSAAGLALAKEFGLESHSWVWHDILKVSGNRFTDTKGNVLRHKSKKYWV